jgi:amino acid adenylation domain-containing protein/non-ribosomal peptide synthase protein (TIGR01720 family)
MRKKMSEIIDIYALSPLQEGFLFHTLYDSHEEQSFAYVNQLCLLVAGHLDLDTFERSWKHLIQRHDIFRTVFVWENIESPVQVVYENVPFTLRREDWSNLPKEEQQQKLMKIAKADRIQGFQLDEAPLMRVMIIREAENQYRIVATYHHLLLDGWSSSLILHELFTTYEKMMGGEAWDLSKPPAYQKYIRWIGEQDKEQAELFWRKELTGFVAPTPLGMVNKQAWNESGHGESIAQLTEEQTKALEQWARKNQITLNTVIQGAWAYLLSRYSGENDIVFGVTSSGRSTSLTGVEKMVGLFINTLPARVHISEQANIIDWLQDLQTKELTRRQYEHTSLTEIQGWSEVPRGTPLFQTLYVYENYPSTPSYDKSGIDILELRREEQTNYPLNLIVVPGDRLSIQLMYEKRNFDDKNILQIQNHLVQVLSQMISDKEKTLSEIVYLLPQERKQLFDDWNGINVKYPGEHVIHKLFEEQAVLHPEAVAVVFQNWGLTYRELNQRANQLAYYLQRRGLRAESLIGICMERSLEMIIGILGILKAGGVYVPLDPASPQHRLQYILEDAGVNLVISQSGLYDWMPDGIDVICVNEKREIIACESTETTTTDVEASHLAYIIYTSGSTGNPKGVMVEHQNVVRLFKATDNWFRFNEHDVWTLFHSYAFDFSVWEIWGALLYGGRLVVVPYLISRSPEEFHQLLLQEKVTVLNQTPSAFKQLTQIYSNEAACLSLRYVIFGGEVLEPSSLLPWFQRTGKNDIQFVNMYGITETTVHVTYYPLTKHDAENGLANVIGRPIPDLQLYVLDTNLQPVAVGITGELYVGGAGLTRGYLNRPELTAERFIDNPFSDCPDDEKLYRTGDIVKYLPSGNLEYIGRIDNQVKIRGFRIELGEIEAALSEHPAVKQAIVIALEDKLGDKYLVAYVMGEGDIASCREHVKALLPSYMLPAYFVKVDAMALTSNGKIDTKALPSPNLQKCEDYYVTPRNHSEQLVASVWSQVLGVEKIGCYDSFFELGGHSLLATQVVSRLRIAFDIEFPLRELFEYPTVEALAERIVQLRQGEQVGKKYLALQPVERGGELPLSYAQQRLWFLDQFEPNSALYNIPTSWRLKGTWDIKALQDGINAMIRRHEVLRTVIQEIDGVPMQYIRAYEPRMWSTIKLMHLSANDRELEMKRLMHDEANAPFDFGKGPLIRVQWIQMGKEDWVFLCTMHHIISDGWSMDIFIKEWLALYEEAVSGTPATLSPLPVQYADFAMWQREWLREDVLEQQLQFWKGQLVGELPVLQLPTDRPRPSIQSYRGAMHYVVFPNPLLEQLKALSREENCTLFMTLLAAYQGFLSRYTGQTDILVGSPIANRNYREIEEMIGLFVNTLVYRADLINDPTFKHLLSSVRQQALQAHEHQDVPFEKIVEAVQPERSMSHTPIFQTMFNWQNDLRALLELSDRTMEWMVNSLSVAKFDLTVTMGETDKGLCIAFEYNTDLFDAATIERIAEHFGHWLQQIITHPEEPIGSLELMSKVESKLLLEEWNDTRADYSDRRLLHNIIEEQVVNHPDAVAVVFEESYLTYRELNERSNQLAHYLQQRGVGAECLVGISMERSLDMVVGLIGIMKAGGAYVPLDPTYPVQRLHYMLQDAGIEVIVTQEAQEQWLPEGIQAICLDRDHEHISEECKTSPASGVNSKNLAYVIYTSGSTGNPKGVMLEHSSLLNFMYAMKQRLPFTHDDVWLSCTSISFDISILELFFPLLSGAKVIVASQSQVLDGRELASLIERSSATYLQATPMMWHLLLDSGYRPSSRVTMLVGGEALSLLLAQVLTQGGGQVFNMFGPTESTIWSTMWQVKHDQIISIGRPICNTDVYVLDSRLQPTPIGTVGELYIGGAGLARGYLNRSELTAERFIDHPFSSQLGARIYRTGDLVKYLKDGNLEYVGRIDNQVKIRGVRIELGEIESILNQHPSVKQTAVVVRDYGPGDKRIVAYVVGDQTIQKWREYVNEKLPNYMVPSHFVEIDALPLTPNGKVDRKALPAPDYQRMEGSYVAPKDSKERALASIWEQVLGITSIGIHDNYFENGGDSILSTQIISRANKAGLQFTIKQLFEHQTIRELAKVAEEIKQIYLEQGAVTGEVPLTPIQHWFFEQGHPNMDHWNQSMFLRTRDKLDTDLLRGALQSIVNHHDALRLRYEVLPNGTWKQSNQDIGDQVLLEVIKPHGLAGTEWEQRIKKVTEQHQASLNLQKGPMLRAVYFDEGDDGPGRLLLVVHHLVVDGVSWRIILEDLQTAYEHSRKGITIQLPAKSTSYKEWAERLNEYGRTSIPEDVQNYWKQQSEIEPRGLPAPRADEIATEASTEQVTIVLSEEETRALLQDAPAKYRAHISEILLAALAGAVSHWANVSAMTIHVEGHGREGILEGIDISRTVGWFTSLYPVHLDITGAATPLETLKAVKEEIRRIPNKGVDYGALRYLNPEMSSVFKQQVKPAISFNYLGQFDQLISSQSIFSEHISSDDSNYDYQSMRLNSIAVIGIVKENKLQITWKYSNQQWTSSRVQAVVQMMLEQLKLLSQCSHIDTTYMVSDFTDADLNEKSLNKFLTKMSKKRGRK